MDNGWLLGACWFMSVTSNSGNVRKHIVAHNHTSAFNFQIDALG